jgi:hypothetical protein
LSSIAKQAIVKEGVKWRLKALIALEMGIKVVPVGLTEEEVSLLTGRALNTKLFVLRLRHWEVLGARFALAIVVTAALMLSGFMAWRLNRLLTIYDREMMYRRISTNWLIQHGTRGRRSNDS